VAVLSLCCFGVGAHQTLEAFRAQSAFVQEDRTMSSEQRREERNAPPPPRAPDKPPPAEPPPAPADARKPST
jgi:hypothetical protein